jgi:presenilin-like A22 family membrane protease
MELKVKDVLNNKYKLIYFFSPLIIGIPIILFYIIGVPMKWMAILIYFVAILDIIYFIYIIVKSNRKMAPKIFISICCIAGICVQLLLIFSIIGMLVMEKTGLNGIQ